MDCGAHALTYPSDIENPATEPALSRSSMLVLPVELVVNILSAVDFRSLLACRRVCRLLYMLVDGTAELQYCIQLAVAGMEDGPPSSMSPAERLDKLRQYMTAWDALEWGPNETIEMSAGNLWELYGGVLAQCVSDGGIKLRQLPSDHRCIKSDIWFVETLGIHVRDFTMDPSQDLLVLIENPTWQTSSNEDRAYRIHLRNLHTGKAHASAKMPVITHQRDTRDFLIRYTLQVSGDHIGLLMHGGDGENELLIVEWKTGLVEMIVFGNEMRSFAFLTDKHVIVGALQTSTIKPSVLVMNFKEANPESVHLDDAEYQASFEIPKFRSQTNLSNISIRTDPAPTWMPHPDLQVPFFSARNGRLYVLELWLEYGRPMDLVIPSSTLISRLDDNRILEQIPWEDWGPTGTRMMLLPRHSHTWVCYVFGTKFVIKKQFRQTTYLQVYDFNQLALQQALRSGDAPSDTTAFEVRTSTVPVHGVFLNDVHTSLPYRIKTVHLQIDPGHDLMCSEDSLVIVEMGLFRILTF